MNAVLDAIDQPRAKRAVIEIDSCDFDVGNVVGLNQRPKK